MQFREYLKEKGEVREHLMVKSLMWIREYLKKWGHMGCDNPWVVGRPE
jgi:hypothetical protein